MCEDAEIYYSIHVRLNGQWFPYNIINVPIKFIDYSNILGTSASLNIPGIDSISTARCIFSNIKHSPYNTGELGIYHAGCKACIKNDT